jgi:hypothetical protein
LKRRESDGSIWSVISTERDSARRGGESEKDGDELEKKGCAWRSGVKEVGWSG